MIVYYILLGAILLLGYFFCVRTPSRGKKIAFLAIILSYMWFLATFRQGIGFDYESYIYIFNKVRETEGLKNLFALPWEIGFVLLTKAITMVSSSTVFMYGVYATVTLIPIGFFVYKYCDDAWLSMWLYVTLAFFYTNMNFMRQSIACSVFVLSYGFLKNKKFLPYLLITLLAAGFHKTALIMIPIYFLVHIKLNKVVIAVYATLVVVTFSLSSQIINLITDFVFKNYKDSFYVVNGYSAKFLLVPITAMIICISLFFIWRQRDPDASMLLNLVIISSTIWLFSMRHMIVERFSMYNYIFLLIALPSALRSLQSSPEVLKERDTLAHQIETSRGKPRQQDVAALEALTIKIADHRVYYWSAVVGLLLVTFLYNSFGMYENGFHQVFPYQSVLSWLS